jgi:hypothetical protein
MQHQARKQQALQQQQNLVYGIPQWQTSMQIACHDSTRAGGAWLAAAAGSLSAAATVNRSLLQLEQKQHDLLHNLHVVGFANQRVVNGVKAS